MYRRYARSKRGKRVNIRMSGKRNAWIGLAAAQREGVLLVPHAYGGMMKASVFEDWFEVKLLSCLPQGHAIIMDNASFHKKKVLYNLTGKYSQALIFLPQYSPEYNPSELTWSALKRKVAGGLLPHDSVSLALDAVLESN